MEARDLKAAIEVDSLYKTFSSRYGTIDVLADITLSVRQGEFVALVGPSGGGKSTLLNIMAGLEQPTSGSIRIHGQRVGLPPPIAYMQQKDLLLPWRTLWENILLGPEIKHRKASMQAQAQQLLHTFQLQDFATAYPAQLSGGMRQRAALIRTLLCEQDILLLDEPFGALDAITRTRLQAYLLRVWQDLHQTIVLVTHDVEEALLLCNRVVLLTPLPGRIADQVRVEIPHSARRLSTHLQALKAHILEQLGIHGT